MLGTVQFAHEHGILHRDIKPGNILLDGKGEPHLTDFGLARLTEDQSTVTKTSDVLGTPSYMAPEQARGDAKGLGVFADVYSLGAVLYHVLTNTPPFAGNTTYETIRMVLEDEPQNPRVRNAKIDNDLATICLKCLEKEPAKRYPTALAFAEDLERWLRREPVHARPAGPFVRAAKFIRRNRVTVGLPVGAMTAAVLVIAATWTIRSSSPISSGIAVLPFQNLGDQTDEFFADGIQDDLLSKLSKIAALKVISRSSVMSYHGREDVRQVGRSLNVGHVLEGNIRRDDGKMQIEAKLIDTRTGLSVWSDRYDRDLNEILSSDGEIAVKVAERLRVNLSGTDREELAKPMTGDLTAFDLYSRARDLFFTAGGSNNGKQEMIEATSLLNQAIAHDSSFFEAYCQLAWVHGQLYILGHDHTPQRLALAEAAVDAAFRLRPKAGEARIARAQNLYRGHLDYAGALAELDLAARTVPNDSRLFELRGYVLRRMGKYEDGLRELQHAVELDPRNVTLLSQISLFYANLRRFAEVQAACDRILAIDPNNVDAIAGRAGLAASWKADIRPWHDAIESIRSTNPGQIRRIADSWLTCALYERNVAWAKQALIAAGDNTPINVEAVHFNRPFAEAIIARLEHNEAKAQAAFAEARAEQEKIVRAQPDYAPALCALGLIDAGLGRKEDALREGRRAVELLPPEKDAINGPAMVEFLGMIAAWAGDQTLACEEIVRAANLPGPTCYGELKLWPLWDPIRGDPQFEKIVASMAPKTANP